MKFSRIIALTLFALAMVGAAHAQNPGTRILVSPLPGSVWAGQGPVSPGVASTTSLMGGCVYVAAGVTLTDGQQVATQCGADGSIKTTATFTGSVSVGAVAAASAPTYAPGSQPLSQDLSGNLRVLWPSGSAVTANAGTNLNTSALALESGGNLATLAGGVTASKYQTNVAQLNGAAINIGTGASGTGTLRAAIASDTTWTPQLAAGTNTIGNVGRVAVTSGGTSLYSLIAAASNNSTSVKGSAGQVTGVQAYNAGSSIGYLKLYNKATAPTCGTDTPVKVVLIPASSSSSGSGANFILDPGADFSLGIGICVVAGIANSDNTSVAASQFAINLDYK